MVQSLKRAVLGVLALLLAATWVLAEDARDKDKDGPLDPQEFVKKVGHINYGEIAAGMLAVQRGGSPGVKQYGMRLVEDHQKANQDLTRLGAKKTFVLAGGPDEKHKAIGDKLARLEGAAFDKEFLHHMVMGHKEAIRLFETQAKSGKDADVKSFAEMTLPTLRAHLKEAEKLQGGAGSGDKNP